MPNSNKDEQTYIRDKQVERPKFCSNCGTGLIEDANFCVNCGTPVKVPEPVVMNHPTAQEQNVSIEEDTRVEEVDVTSGEVIDEVETLQQRRLKHHRWKKWKHQKQR